ncbi:hypothetical protein G7077_02985 [Sphingomonas piscis]|uniref:Uncharacterized protein n=1 Tax=Sphingomonas piscis TaxID=2714943 RepID=A0A6G7YMR9_9SPHN|nr:hypothetical protein [Sphingomonas piscis]QIK78027.1 hypothetical protein G7077_02985 [Sphingomonas piscis]
MFEGSILRKANIGHRQPLTASGLKFTNLPGKKPVNVIQRGHELPIFLEAVLN